MKETGKRILEYLSMSEGETPPIFCKFFLQCSIGGTWWSISSLALLAPPPWAACCWAPPPPGRSREVLPPRPPIILAGPRRSKGSCILIRISCKAEELKWGKLRLFSCGLVVCYLPHSLFREFCNSFVKYGAFAQGILGAFLTGMRKEERTSELLIFFVRCLWRVAAPK